jgi:hypothetical protein
MVPDPISNVLGVLYDARSPPLAVLQRRSVMAVELNPPITGPLYIRAERWLMLPSLSTP